MIYILDSGLESSDYHMMPGNFFFQGVLSLTFAEDAAKPSKQKEKMYSARPEIEVLLYNLITLFSCW